MRLTDAADLLQIECILVDPQGDGFIRAIFLGVMLRHGGLGVLFGHGMEHAVLICGIGHELGPAKDAILAPDPFAHAALERQLGLDPGPHFGSERPQIREPIRDCGIGIALVKR